MSTRTILRRRFRDEGAFTVIETTVALAVVFVLLTGTLATYAASVRGTLGGRQRTAAVTVAREVVEEARAALYSQVGHDLAGDTTLADDAEVTSGSPPTFGGEALVGVPTPHFAQHRWTTTRDGKEYTIRAFVTWVTPADADPYKRLTVAVVPTAAAFAGTAVDTEVRVSSYLFPADVPPDPLLEGAVDVDGTVFQVTGSVGGVSVAHATIAQPTASGVLTSLFTRSTTGSARSSTSLIELLSGSLTGCDVDAGGTTSDCSGVRADTATDSDAATYHPEDDSAGPVYDGSHTVSAGSALGVTIGANDSVQAAGTSRSCFSCFAVDIGDDDLLAYQSSEGKGPGNVDVAWDTGSASGSLMTTSGLSRALATLDQDVASDSHKLAASGRWVMPALDIVTVSGGPSGFAGAVRVGAVDVTASAEAGPTAAAPGITGSSVSVSVYDTLGGGSLGYRTLSLTPGEEQEDSGSATFTAGSATVTLTTTVTSGGRTVDSSTGADGHVAHAEASLTNWLRIEVQLVVTDATGTVADLIADVDYGRVAARADYEAP